MFFFVFKALAALHYLCLRFLLATARFSRSTSYGFAVFFDGATKVNARTVLEQKATIYLTRTTAHSPADTSRHRGCSAFVCS